MRKKKMEELRKVINNMICSEDCDYNKLVELSQELDVLIVEDIKISMYVKKVLGCELSEQFNNLINKVELVQDDYKYVRIVDPINKEVLSLKGDKIEKNQFECYKFWGRENPCEYCASIKAWQECKVKIKIENIDNNIYILTSVPIYINDKYLILELVKKVTNSFYEEKISKVNLKSSIDREYFNEKLINDELVSLYNRKLIDESFQLELVNENINN
ncbi:MAG: aspartyl-phosphate phosphatase Spo0E family protein [Clostridiales bacterium]|uniref:Spo0E family sporulation regulatory protein-aspartic acid phosphatase n=1 Tax=Clostridium sp. N3C TaxID=1776758 RepID=UPI00092E1ECA|nr:Spo0E family sporulation regulatory protein-aspartic acid phosphatase [Clostridium sp. N3C]NLZ47782.1 aspartyl-phosphate phosphatase Spo0E family protein [Clostridiales bacterium]SCN24923.1 hypothetical protein N3C_2065 [Clostridium sp. N3C]